MNSQPILSIPMMIAILMIPMKEILTQTTLRIWTVYQLGY